jgi:hypothetical protein
VCDGVRGARRQQTHGTAACEDASPVRKRKPEVGKEYERSYVYFQCYGTAAALPGSHQEHVQKTGRVPGDAAAQY